MAIETTSQRLRRAIELGRELANIRDDRALHSLSAESWRRHSCRLGNFAGEAELAAAIEKLERCRFLVGEVRVRATLWVRDPTDEPAVWTGFADEQIGERAYAEALHAGLSVEALSAIASVWSGEQRPAQTFGRLDSWRDLQRLEEPRHRELVEIDEALATTVRVSDLTWHNGRPFLEHGGVSLELGEHNVGHLASELALAVGRQAAAPAPVPA